MVNNQKNTKECYNCESCIQDNNYETVWEECRNPNSEHYYENVNNIHNRTCKYWTQKTINKHKKKTN